MKLSNKGEKIYLPPYILPNADNCGKRREYSKKKDLKGNS